MKKITLLLLLAGFLLSGTTLSVALDRSGATTEQDQVQHRASPVAIAALSHGESYLKIVYGQPYKRGRQIFGGLVPFGEVWRTGANEATEITLTRAVRMGGNRVEPGTYALFTIPKENEWTVILNRKLGQWGAFSYDSSFDLLRFNRPSRPTGETVEAMRISFSEVENGRTTLTIEWDDRAVDIPIEL